MARVLCMDPDADRRERTTSLFAAAGHACRTAASVGEALDALRGEAGCDAIVACLEVDGADFARLCAALGRTEVLGGAVRILHGRCPSTAGPGSPAGLLPADIYIEELEDVAHLVRAVEWLLNTD